MNERESAIEAVKAAFEPVPTLSAKTIRMNKFEECRLHALDLLVRHCLPLPPIPQEEIQEYLDGHCDMEPAHGEVLALLPQSVDLRLDAIVAIFVLPGTILRAYVPPLLRALNYELVEDLTFPDMHLAVMAVVGNTEDEILDQYVETFSSLGADRIHALGAALICVSDRDEFIGDAGTANGLRNLGQRLLTSISPT